MDTDLSQVSSGRLFDEIRRRINNRGDINDFSRYIMEEMCGSLEKILSTDSEDLNRYI